MCPITGGAQAMPDLIAGRVQMAHFAGGYPFVNDGKLKCVPAVLGAQRHVTRPMPDDRSGSERWRARRGRRYLRHRKRRRMLLHGLRGKLKRPSSPATREQFARQAVVGESSSPAKLVEAGACRRTIVWQRFVKEFNIPGE